MYPVFESIAVMDGVYQNLGAHNRRVQRTANTLWKKTIADNYLEEQLPVWEKRGLYKCRFIYNEIGCTFSFTPYIARHIHTLYVKEVADLWYPHKYTYREMIEIHTRGLQPNEDVLFTRNGLILDTSYANVALLKDGLWYTPETPLLLGTQRERALSTGELLPKKIHLNELCQYEQLMWFNAMIPLGQAVLPLSKLIVL